MMLQKENSADVSLKIPNTGSPPSATKANQEFNKSYTPITNGQILSNFSHTLLKMHQILSAIFESSIAQIRNIHLWKKPNL